MGGQGQFHMARSDSKWHGGTLEYIRMEIVLSSYPVYP